jgi:acetyl-CoA acyltransferase
MHDVLIAAYARSPFTFAKKGALARTRPDDLAAAVVRGLLARLNIDPATIEDLILGCAMPEAEQGLNLGRLVGLLADLPITVAGVTVNRLRLLDAGGAHGGRPDRARRRRGVFVCRRRKHEPCAADGL